MFEHSVPIRHLTWAALAAVGLPLAACVTTGTHEKALAELAATQRKLAGAEQATLATQQQLDRTQTEKGDLNSQLGLAMERNATLAGQLKDLGKDVEQLSDERSQLTQERERLQSELEQLRRMRSAAEKRNAQYARLLSKLRAMIDAGTLEVQVRGGRMLVRLSNDVLFPPGGTKLKEEGVAALRALSGTIKEFTDRRFQVMGHSDATPISTPRFPSNWELSSQRAIEVVRLLIDNGVPPQMLSAAGQAEFDPLAPNDSDDNKAQNRRVEIVFVPTIDEMPDFSETDGAPAAPASPALPSAAPPKP